MNTSFFDQGGVEYRHSDPLSPWKDLPRQDVVELSEMKIMLDL